MEGPRGRRRPLLCASLEQEPSHGERGRRVVRPILGSACRSALAFQAPAHASADALVWRTTMKVAPQSAASLAEFSSCALEAVRSCPAENVVRAIRPVLRILPPSTNVRPPAELSDPLTWCAEPAHTSRALARQSRERRTDRSSSRTISAMRDTGPCKKTSDAHNLVV